VTGAATAGEAEMMRALLAAEGIRVTVRAAPGFGVLTTLADGPRDLLVPAGQHAAALALVESHFGLDRPFA
jgi:hypothetical protein